MEPRLPVRFIRYDDIRFTRLSVPPAEKAPNDRPPTDDRPPTSYGFGVMDYMKRHLLLLAESHTTLWERYTAPVPPISMWRRARRKGNATRTRLGEWIAGRSFDDDRGDD